jgi:hypothetical protein
VLPSWFQRSTVFVSKNKIPSCSNFLACPDLRFYLSVTAESVQEKEQDDIAARNVISSTLDPLLLVLSRDYVDDNDLTTRLQKLFKVERVIECTESDHYVV